MRRIKLVTDAIGRVAATDVLDAETEITIPYVLRIVTDHGVIERRWDVLPAALLRPSAYPMIGTMVVHDRSVPFGPNSLDKTDVLMTAIERR